MYGSLHAPVVASTSAAKGFIACLGFCNSCLILSDIRVMANFRLEVIAKKQLMNRPNQIPPSRMILTKNSRDCSVLNKVINHVIHITNTKIENPVPPFAFHALRTKMQ